MGSHHRALGSMLPVVAEGSARTRSMAPSVPGLGQRKTGVVDEGGDILPPEVVDRFWPTGWASSRVRPHDAADRDHLVDLGVNEMGDLVEVNDCLVESDLLIYFNLANRIIFCGPKSAEAASIVGATAAPTWEEAWRLACQSLGSREPMVMVTPNVGARMPLLWRVQA